MNQTSRRSGVLGAAGLLFALTVAVAGAAATADPVSTRMILDTNARFYDAMTGAAGAN